MDHLCWPKKLSVFFSENKVGTLSTEVSCVCGIPEQEISTGIKYTGKNVPDFK